MQLELSPFNEETLFNDLWSYTGIWIPLKTVFFPTLITLRVISL